MAQSALARGKEGFATLVLSISSAAEFLSEFDAYLGTAKGLAEGTRRKYARFVQGFLDGWCGDSPPNWQDLSIEDLRAYQPHCALAPDTRASKRLTSTPMPILATKERALEKQAPAEAAFFRFKPSDSVLAFLQQL